MRLIADASDYLAKSRTFRRLPTRIRRTAFNRSHRRITSMMRTAYIKRAAPRLKIAQKHIRSRTKARFDVGGQTSVISVKSGWIPLHKLGASQNSKGVTVRLRGSYRHAFIAAMASGHTGVFLRDGAPRLPISELFGPNPAHDIINNDDVYLDLLEQIMDDHLAPRVLHEVSNLLSR